MTRNILIIFIVLFNFFTLAMQQEGVSFPDDNIIKMVCSILKIDNIEQIHSIKQHRVSKKYYKKLSKDKQFKKENTKLLLSESFKKKTDIISISLIRIDRIKFLDLEQINKTFLKIKYNDGKTEFIKIIDIDVNSYFKGLTNAIEFKRSGDTASALGDEQWSADWRAINLHAEIYNKLEEQMLELFKRMFTGDLNARKLKVLEIASGKGDFAYKLLDQTDIAQCILFDYNEKSCQEAQEKLKKFGDRASVIQGNALTYNFHEFTKDTSPDVIIASGALTTMVFNDAQECRCVLKKLIEIMPEGGKIILTGLMPQHISLKKIQEIYPFKVLQRHDLDAQREFLVLEKQAYQIKTPQVQKNGTLDLFHALQHRKDNSTTLQDILNSLSGEERAKVKHVDLSVCKLEAKELSALSLLPNVKSLSLAHVCDMNDILKNIQIGFMTKLKSLDLSYTNVSKQTLQELMAKTKLKKLRLDLCENLSKNEQLAFILKAATQASKLNLSFLVSYYYRDEIINVINLLLSRKFAATRVLVPKSLADEIIANKDTLELFQQFLVNRDLEIIMDGTISRTKEEIKQEQKEISKIFLEFKGSLPEIKEPFLSSSKLDTKEKSCYKNLKKLSHGIPDDNLRDLIQFIEKNKSNLILSGKKEQETQLLNKGNCTIYVLPNGQIFIRSKSSKCPIIGKGSLKTVKLGLMYPDENHTPDLVAIYTLDPLKEPLAIKAISIIYDQMLSCESLAGLVPMIALSTYHSKKSNKEKVLIIAPYYSRGSLDQFLKNNCLSSNFRRTIVEYLFQGVKRLHEMGFVHCDIHLGNLFINGDYRVALGDYDLALPMSDSSELRKINFSITPPEILQAQLKSNIKFNHFNNKIDIWQIGLVLAKLYNIEVAFVDRITELVQNEAFKNTSIENKINAILNIMENFPFEEPVNVNSIEHLTWQMLRPDPSLRISLSDAKEKLDKIACVEQKSITFKTCLQVSSYANIYK